MDHLAGRFDFAGSGKGFLASANARCSGSWVIGGINGLCLDRTPVGWGGFAGRNFAEGEIVFTFMDAILNLKQTLDLGLWSFSSVRIGKDLYVDPEPPGAFINHSCSPNCGIRCSVSLVAVVAIKRGAELVMDYSTCMADDPETMACACGSPNCRGVVGDLKSVNPTTRALFISRIISFFSKNIRELVSKDGYGQGVGFAHFLPTFLTAPRHGGHCGHSCWRQLAPRWY